MFPTNRVAAAARLKRELRGKEIGEERQLWEKEKVEATPITRSRANGDRQIGWLDREGQWLLSGPFLGISHAASNGYTWGAGPIANCERRWRKTL